MKSLYSLILAVGLGLTLSVGAQTTTDEQKQQQQPSLQPEQGQQQTTTTEQPREKAQPERATKQQQSVQQPNERERARTNADENVNRDRTGRDRTNADTRVRTDERSERGEHGRVGAEGQVSHATTVFRHGRETHENLALHRGVRERSDVHFRIGTHPRDWWLQTYSIVLIDSCHYYLADDGCWYPAYGFDPSCDFPEGVVYCD
jgi:hypothetical protein